MTNCVVSTLTGGLIAAALIVIGIACYWAYEGVMDHIERISDDEEW